MTEYHTLIDEIHQAKPGTQMYANVDIPDNIILEKNYFSIVNDIVRYRMREIMAENCHIYKIEQRDVPMDCRVRGVDVRFRLYFIKMGNPEKVGFKINPTHWGFT